MIFEMSGGELYEANKWIREHNKVCTIYNGDSYSTIGGQITYTFTPTSLGMACGIMCACGKQHECTDVSDW